MKTKKLLCFMALFAIVLCMPAIGSASEPNERRHSARQTWEELHLTPEQEVKFRDINAKHAPVRRNHAELMGELRERISQELQKDRPNRNLLAQWAGQMGEYQKRANIASVDHMLDVKAVLTPEQFKIFISRTSIGGR